jgi:hypothetical protein
VFSGVLKRAVRVDVQLHARPEEGNEMQSIDPSTRAPEDIYKLMIGLIVPRPIAFVSTVDAQGRRNLAPLAISPDAAPIRR